MVDLSVAFTRADSPLGCELDRAIEEVERLLAAARAGQSPVIYTTVAYADERDHEAAAVFLQKVPALRMLDARSTWVEIDPRISPRPDETILTKLYASAFFGTRLTEVLADAAVDTVVVCGASTSGCVRATVVDALQTGLRALVPREAVGDRDAAAHEQALRDIDSRYGDVIGVADAAALLEGTSGAPGL